MFIRGWVYNPLSLGEQDLSEGIAFSLAISPAGEFEALMQKQSEQF